MQVWATDLWISASENIQRIRDAGVEEGVFPIHADARSLPFAANFFDAIVCIDSFNYFGSDDLYLNYLAHFVKPGGPIGIAGAGLVREINSWIRGSHGDSILSAQKARTNAQVERRRRRSGQSRG